MRTPAKEAREAFRDEIYGQRLELKDAWFGPGSCVAIDSYTAWSVVIYGNKVPRDACEVDHFLPTFAELLTHFLLFNGIELEQVKTRRSDGPEGNKDFLIADPSLSEAWRSWHRQYSLTPALLWLSGKTERLSGLRVVSVQEHRQITSQQQRGRKG